MDTTQTRRFNPFEHHGSRHIENAGTSSSGGRYDGGHPTARSPRAAVGSLGFGAVGE